MSDSNDTGIVWADPPVRVGKGWSKWAPVAVQLKSRPQTWALVESGASNANLANQIRNGMVKAFEPKGSYEARMVSTPDGKDTYARYVGGES